VCCEGVGIRSEDEWDVSGCEAVCARVSGKTSDGIFVFGPRGVTCVLLDCRNSK